MEAYIYHANRKRDNEEGTREFNTLDELLQFTDQVQKRYDANGIILRHKGSDEWSIAIYDDFVE